MKKIILVPVLLLASIILCWAKPPKPKKNNLPEIGKASYYSDSYIGKKTATAEVYRPEDLTAAHQTLPLGTKVKVTSLSNAKSVIVTINDRCNCKKVGRIIDLSKSAATELEMIEKGVVKVKIEALISI